MKSSFYPFALLLLAGLFYSSTFCSDNLNPPDCKESVVSFTPPTISIVGIDPVIAVGVGTPVSFTAKVTTSPGPVVFQCAGPSSVDISKITVIHEVDGPIGYHDSGKGDSVSILTGVPGVYTVTWTAYGYYEDPGTKKQVKASSNSDSKSTTAYRVVSFSAVGAVKKGSTKDFIAPIGSSSDEITFEAVLDPPASSELPNLLTWNSYGVAGEDQFHRKVSKASSGQEVLSVGCGTSYVVTVVWIEKINQINVLGATKISATSSGDGSSKSSGNDKYATPVSATGDVTISVSLDPAVRVSDLPSDFIAWTKGNEGADQHERKVSKKDPFLDDCTVTCGSSSKGVKILVFDLEFITPKNDPIKSPKDGGDGQNQFTFDSSSSGSLTLRIKVLAKPSGAAKILDKQGIFNSDAIGIAKKSWSSDNPEGKSIWDGSDNLVANLVYNGLPVGNADFGRKKTSLSIIGKFIQADWAAFFDKNSTNHPGKGAGTDPNWFYYWKEGGVVPAMSSLKATYTGEDGWGRSTGLGLPIELGVRAPTDAFDATFPSSLPETTREAGIYHGVAYKELTFPAITGIGGSGKGIRCVAVTLKHENEHNVLEAKKPDLDKDGVSNADEEGGVDGATTHPGIADTYNLHYDDGSYADSELRCRIIEGTVSAPSDYDPAKDWANPGCQSAQSYGP